jgi:formylglycine-generating enzyme required for sulfatase activity
VSWNDAQAFCTWLAKRTGRTIRLPTEAQWEYACRAGSTTHWSWGDDPAGGKGKCNAADKTGKARFRRWRVFNWADGHVFTCPVGTYQPNAFGLYDMHGNVWEWCRDWYRRSYASAGQTDPKGRYADRSGPPRVVRGGSWMSTPGRCRSASRAACGPLGSPCDFIIGFRVAADAKPAPNAPGAAPTKTRHPPQRAGAVPATGTPPAGRSADRRRPARHARAAREPR